MKLLFAMLIGAVLAATALAADVAGTWKGTLETPNGSREMTCVFKTAGAELTGTVNFGGDFGEAAISEGKIDGDSISFVVARNFNGNDIRLIYKGKVAGDEMKLKMEVSGMDMTMDITLKRIP